MEKLLPAHQTTTITYGYHASPFGKYLLGVTKDGVCHLVFFDSKKEALAGLMKSWPKATLVHDDKKTPAYTTKIFTDKGASKPIPVVLQGTAFQIKVWEALRKIPRGQTTSYTAIAKAAGNVRAVRAVGSACGKNNIAFLIPCHRVLTAGGALGGYRWGEKRKKAMLAWEALRRD